MECKGYFEREKVSSPREGEMKRSLNFEKMLWAEVSLRSYQTAYFAGD
jgi:hypothetical protein